MCKVGQEKPGQTKQERIPKRPFLPSLHNHGSSWRTSLPTRGIRRSKLQKAAELKKSRNAAAAKELPERSEGLAGGAEQEALHGSGQAAGDTCRGFCQESWPKMQDLRKDLAMAYVDLALSRAAVTAAEPKVSDPDAQ
eukprot:6472413-Amphidinium_carterae.1